MKMIPSSAQIRAARGLLNWGKSDLAKAAGMSPQTIALMETDNDAPNLGSRAKVLEIMELRGVEFFQANSSAGSGVRWRTPEAETSQCEKEKLELLQKKQRLG